jgi:hypothetical protein
MKSTTRESTRAPEIANAIARPSATLVPLPSSSITTKLFLETFCRINAISLISAENALTLTSIPSSTEILVNKFSNIGMAAYSAGTLRQMKKKHKYNEPICAMMEIIAS